LKLQSRYAREGFRQLLQEHAQSGAINVRSKWKELLPLIERNDRYAAIVDADGSRPAELFYDFIEELEDKLDVDKKRAKDIMRDINLPMTLSMSYEAWCAVMKTHDGWKALDKANTRFLFEDVRLLVYYLPLLCLQF
jgi:pre-mRNA-processing factor 40